MRFMVIVKSDADIEAGQMPTEAELAAMGKYNEALVDAGVMQAGEGLHPSAKGARIRFGKPGSQPTVVDGPFAEAEALVAGFWLWQCESLQAAIDWAQRCPMSGEAELEIRQVFDAADFGAELTPELKAQEERLREKIEAQQGRH